MDIGRFVEALRIGGASMEGTPRSGSVVTVTVVNLMMNMITTVCEALYALVDRRKLVFSYQLLGSRIYEFNMSAVLLEYDTGVL